ncbi:MAG: hypothetical protein AB1899_05145 [Pseudomonadota bacterium]
MSHPARWLPKPPLLLAVAAVIAAGAYFVGRTTPPSPNIQAGMELFSVLPDEILSVTFRNEELQLTARRADPGQAFAVRVEYQDGRPPVQCTFNADLNGQLNALARIMAKGAMTEDVYLKTFTTRLGSVELGDRMVAEPPSRQEYRATPDLGRVAVALDGTVAETATPPQVFLKLAAGCPSGGQAPPD